MNHTKLRDVLNPATRNAIILVCIATALVGVSLGALAASQQIPLWIVASLCFFVLAGSSEFIFIGFLITGAHPIAGAIAGLLINLRHLPFGITVYQLIQGRYKHWLGCHIMNDESVMFGVTQSSFAEKRSAYWYCGLGIVISWPAGVIAGYFMGQLIPDPRQIGLDALFPAVIFALVFPQLKNKATRQTAFLGSLLSLITLPFLATGLPILSALFALLWRRKNDTTT